MFGQELKYGETANELASTLPGVWSESIYVYYVCLNCHNTQIHAVRAACRLKWYSKVIQIDGDPLLHISKGPDLNVVWSATIAAMLLYTQYGL